MELDYIDTQREKRRQIFFGSLIALLILISIAYYFWGNLINKGTIVFTGQAPFVVEFFERGEKFECPNSPCEVAQKIGVKSYYASKEGYESIVANAKVKLWGKVEENLDFKLNPKLEKVNEYPKDEEPPKYKFVFDEMKQMQKLVEADDVTEDAILYFPKSLEQPEIYGVGNMIMAVDRAKKTQVIYKINIEKKSRELISGSINLKNITSGRWSDSGKYFAFSLLRQQGLWLLDDGNNIKKISENTDVQQTVWMANDRLLMVEKNVADDGKVSGYSFKYYYPAMDMSDLIDIDSKIDKRPKNLKSVNGDKEIYFQTEDGTYKLILGQ